MKTTRILSSFFALAFLTFVTVASANPDVKTGKSDPELSTFFSLVEKAGLTAELAKMEGYTVFAPSNAAFAAIGDSVLNALSVEELKEILLNHIVSTKIASAQITEAASVETLGGATLSIVKTELLVKINDTVTVVSADLSNDNGIIHKVDQVIIEAEAATEEVKDGNEEAEKN